MVNIDINLKGEVTEEQAEIIKTQIETAAQNLGLSGSMHIEHEIE